MNIELSDSDIERIAEALEKRLAAKGSPMVAGKPLPDYMSTAEAAKYLRLNENTVMRMVQDGTLPKMPGVRKNLIPRRAVMAVAEKSEG